MFLDKHTILYVRMPNRNYKTYSVSSHKGPRHTYSVYVLSNNFVRTLDDNVGFNSTLVS